MAFHRSTDARKWLPGFVHQVNRITMIFAMAAAFLIFWNTLSWAGAEWVECSPCKDGIKDCVEISSGQISLGKLKTKAFDIYCPATGSKYYRGFCYNRDSKAAKVYAWSNLGWWENKQGHFTATNWSVTSGHWVNVRIACSTDVGDGACILPPDDCRLTDSKRVDAGENYYYYVFTWVCADGHTYICNNALVFRSCCVRY